MGVDIVVCINPRGARDLLESMAANDPAPRVRKAAAEGVKKLEVPKHCSPAPILAIDFMSRYTFI